MALRAGELRHEVLLHNPTSGATTFEGTPETWEELTPSRVWASIRPATARELERVVANAVQSNATHLITIRYHPEVTTKTRITKGERNSDDTLTDGSIEFHVTGVQNPDLRNEMLILVCEQVVQ